MIGRKYSYILLQYVHDVLAEERLNVGVILFAPSTGYLEGRFVSNMGRISAAFPDMHKPTLKNALRSIQKAVSQRDNEYSQRSLFSTDFDLKNFAYSIQLRDDSALQWSEEKFGLLYDEPNLLLEKLFSVYVSRYDRNSKAKESLENNIELSVRSHLQSLGAIVEFQSKTFELQDSITFNNAWHQSKWHAFEAINLDYKQESSILRKAREWRGHLDAALDQSSSFDLKLWLILIKPDNTKFYDTYDQAMRIIQGADISPDIIEPENAAHELGQTVFDSLTENNVETVSQTI